LLFVVVFVGVVLLLLDKVSEPEEEEEEGEEKGRVAPVRSVFRPVWRYLAK